MPEHRHDEPTAADACPAWCRRKHSPDDHADDRLHQSPARYAALVTSPWSDDPYSVALGCSVVGRLVQRRDSRELWVEVTGEEAGELRIAITAESARRLVDLLAGLLAWSS